MSQSSLPDFLSELDKRISDELHTDDFSRVQYSTDASLYQVMPHGVLIPKTVDYLLAAVELAA